MPNRSSSAYAPRCRLSPETTSGLRRPALEKVREAGAAVHVLAEVVELNKADVSDVEPVAFERHPVAPIVAWATHAKGPQIRSTVKGRPSTPMMAWPRVGSGSTYG